MPATFVAGFFILDQMGKDSFVKVGYVMRTHGLKGEVTIKLNPDAPDFEPKDVLMLELETGQVPYFVERVSFKGAQAFVKFEDVDTIDKSELLKGKSIFIQKSMRPKLVRGEYYDDEYVGLEVWNEDVSLGVVNRVINQGMARYLEVGDKSILIPIQGPFITSVSKTKKRIEVELPEGFLDI